MLASQSSAAWCGSNVLRSTTVRNGQSAHAQATGREQECIDLYRVLEDTHPNARVKRQAANLRFIMEAPKLKLGPDERVSIPVLATPNRFACAPNPSTLNAGAWMSVCPSPSWPAQPLCLRACFIRSSRLMILPGHVCRVLHQEETWTPHAVQALASAVGTP